MNLKRMSTFPVDILFKWVHSDVEDLKRMAAFSVSIHTLTSLLV